MTSVWCAAFEKEDLKVMEYYEELSYWYRNGYFYEINTQFACPLMENLVESFEGESLELQDYKDDDSAGNMTTDNATVAAAAPWSPPKATLYFSHSTAILPFLSLLGLNKDEYVLTASNYEEAKSRKYRVSKMDSFAANIGFLMMECDEAPMERVMTFHQERPIMLPNCDELACDWQTFKEIYADDINCQFEEICDDDGAPLKRFTVESNSVHLLANLMMTLISIIIIKA